MYPTSADLAAFRRSIPYQPVPGIVHPFSTTGQEQHPIVGTAWDAERQHGIGATVGPRGNIIWRASEPSTEARRGATALRSRAYAAGWWRLPRFNVDAPGHPGEEQSPPHIGPQRPGTRYYVAAWPTEQQHGCPTWEPEEPTCPACGGDASPDGPGCRCYGD